MIKKILLAVLIVPTIAILGLIITDNRFILTAFERTYLQGNRTANINDHTAFRTHLVKTDKPTDIANSSDHNQHLLSPAVKAHLENYGTAAYLVVHNGQVISEHYFNDYHERSKTNSFSMAKTVMTLLIGVAIEQGYIESLEQKITHFMPEFSNDPLGKNATIGQLSTMTTGYEWTEHYYSPFSPTVELLYGDDVESFLMTGLFSQEPGSYFEYSSASTQLLGIVLKRALAAQQNPQTISEFLSEHIWQPLQMNDDALWHTDESGMELVFCCINTNARNFAKLGLLMLNNGQWNGKEVVPKHFVDTMTEATAAPYYGYSTWLNSTYDPPYYWFSGHLGQYIIVIPDKKIVVVRLGETRDTDTDFRINEIPLLVDEALRLSEMNYYQ